MRDRLCEALTTAGVPWLSVTGDGPGCVVAYRPGSTAGQRAAGDAIRAGFDWSPAAQAAWEIGRRKAAACAAMGGWDDPAAVASRAANRVVLAYVGQVVGKLNVVIEELNSKLLTLQQDKVSKLPVPRTWAELVAAAQAACLAETDPGQ